MRSVAAVLAISALIALSGCSLDRTGLAGDQTQLDASVGLDASAIDGGVDAGQVLPDASVDSGVDVDSGIDSGVVGTDAGVDAGIDAGVDAGVDAGIDAGVDAGVDAGTAPMPCDDRYGGLRSYELCAETTTTCEFYVDPSSDSSCDTMCASAGGTCVSARREGSSSNCGSGGARDCSTSYNDVVCTCTR